VRSELNRTDSVTSGQVVTSHPLSFAPDNAALVSRTSDDLPQPTWFSIVGVAHSYGRITITHSHPPQSPRFLAYCSYSDNARTKSNS